MNRKSVLSFILISIFILNTLSILNVRADMPYIDTVTNTSFTVSYTSDDAYYLIGYEFRSNTTIDYLKSSSYDTYTGIIFNSTTIPDGAIINHAYLSLYGSDAVDSNSYLTSIYGIDADDYDTFSNQSMLTGTPLTSAYANWDMKDLEGGAWANSTDLKGLVQEITDRVGWSSGNSLGFRLSSAQSAHGTRSYRSYDYADVTYDPKLYVTYTVSEIVSDANPFPYIEDNNDNWILLNETGGYTWWEVWNTTGSQGSLIFFGQNTETDTYNGSAVNLIRGEGSPYNTVGNSYSIYGEYNGTLYAMVLHNNWAYRIMSSTDNGLNWTEYDGCGGAPYTYPKGYLDTTTGIIHIAYREYYGSLNCFYTQFYCTNNTWSLSREVIGITTLYPTAITVWDNEVWIACNNVVIHRTTITDPLPTGSWVVGEDLRHGHYGGFDYFFEDDEGNLHLIFFPYESTGYPDYAMILYQGIYHCVTETHTDPVQIWYGMKSYNAQTYGFVFDSETEYGQIIGQAVGNDHPVAGCLNGYLYSYRYTLDTNSWDSAKIISSSANIGEKDIAYNTVWYPDEWFASWTYQADLSRIYTAHYTGGAWVDLGYFESTLADGDTYPVEIGTWGSVEEGEHQFILLDPEGQPVDEIPEEVNHPPEYLNSTYDKWLFEGEVYKFEIYVNNTDITYLTLNDTVHTLTFSYNNNTDIYKLEVIDADGTLINQLVAGLITSGKTDYSGNITYIWWKFILNTNIVDCVDRDFSYILHETNSTYDIIITETGIIDANITIYNLGGVIEYTLTGDGGHTIGGHPFELYATNSTLNSTARADIIYRRLQGVHMLVELDTDNEVQGGQSYFEDLSNIGYLEFGIDYKLEQNETGAWIEGWLCRVYVDDIAVGDCGVASDVAWIELRIYWYNRGTLIRGDESIYSYHFGYDKDTFPSPRKSFTFWCDLWFDKSNSSTVFGGRVNPQYYGYYEAGSAWWFNSEFRPLIGNVTSSMLFDDITDSDGNIVSSKEISLVRVHSKVVKTADAGDENTYTVKSFQIMKMQLAKERMEGIDTPDFIETQQLDISGYGMYNVLGGIGSAITGAIMGVSRLMISSIDTFLSYFGLPYGTFSTLMNYISVSFSSLMVWLASATSVFSSALQIFTLLVTNISSFITYTIQAILFFLTDIFTIPLQIIQLIVAVLNGTTITFYGISFDFTPYKDLMDGLKQLLPILASMMYATWLLFGNVSFEGEPDIIGFIGRIRQSFDWVRETYNSIFWIFNAIYAEILFIYAWIKSHIPTMGGTPSTAPDTS